MAYRIMHGSGFLFALHAFLQINNILATGMNSNKTNNFLRSERFHQFVKTISTFNAVQNSFGLFDVNATLQKHSNTIDVSQRCYDDLQVTAKALANRERWALQSK